VTDAIRDVRAVLTPMQHTLVNAGLRLAVKHGFDHVSRAMVAAKTGVSEALLSYYWTAPMYQNAMMRQAIETRNLTVVAQGLAAQHPVALAAPADLQREAANSLVRDLT